MSATFKLSKKKFTQHDLRKLMHQQQKKTLTNSSSSSATLNSIGGSTNTIGVPSAKKIDSPLAKYNDLGQLMCILCKSIVRSEDVWKVHINAKQHKENIELAKRLKEQTKNFTVPIGGKRTNVQELSSQSADIPTKKLKSILKNGPEETPSTTNINSNNNNNNNNGMMDAIIPMDFFDDNNKSTNNNFYESTMEKTSIRKDLINIQRSGGNNLINNDVELMDVTTTTTTTTDEKLPEGFFDDPIKDAKARNSEYKDPVEEEWERFQKEMKEAANFSNAIIAEDQEESTTERQIDEIDEQMRNWSRVLELDRKKQEVIEKNKVTTQISNSLKYSDNINSNNKKEIILTIHNSNSNNDTDSDIGDVGSDAGSDNDEFSEYVDWRCKKSHK